MHFTNTANGIPGNEDYGSMATWVMFASLGLYPQSGTSHYLISAPSVVEATIKLNHLSASTSSSASATAASSSQLKIVTYNNTLANTYVQKLLVNGVEHTATWIDRSVLAAPEGCLLEFYMSEVAASGLCGSASRAEAVQKVAAARGLVNK